MTKKKQTKKRQPTKNINKSDDKSTRIFWVLNAVLLLIVVLWLADIMGEVWAMLSFMVAWLVLTESSKKQFNYIGASAIIATAIIISLWLGDEIAGIAAFWAGMWVWCGIIKTSKELDKKDMEIKLQVRSEPAKRAPATKSRSQKTTAPEIPQIVGELDFDIVPDHEIEIEYRDAYGDVTRRAVTAQRIQSQQDGAIFIIGFCHLRQQMRSFRCDRIVRMYFCGEPITINQFLTKVGFYRDRTVKESVAINKLKSMVKNMDESALDGFING